MLDETSLIIPCFYFCIGWDQFFSHLLTTYVYFSANWAQQKAQQPNIVATGYPPLWTLWRQGTNWCMTHYAHKAPALGQDGALAMLAYWRYTVDGVNRRSLLACILAIRQSQAAAFVNKGTPLFQQCLSWLCVVVPLLAVSCTSRVKKRCGVCWIACCGLNITGVWTEMVEFLCMCSNQLDQDGAQTT